MGRSVPIIHPALVTKEIGDTIMSYLTTTISDTLTPEQRAALGVPSSRDVERTLDTIMGRPERRTIGKKMQRQQAVAAMTRMARS